MTAHVALALDGQWRPHRQETSLPFQGMRWRPPAPISHGIALAVDEQLDAVVKAVAKSAECSPLHLPVVDA